MIPASQANTVWVADLLKQRHRRVYKELKTKLNEAGVQLHEIKGCRDIWTQDFSPIQVSSRHYVQFTYNPSYLRDCKHLITPPDVTTTVVPKGSTCTNSNIVLDGGAIVCSRNMGVMTSRVLQENPTYEEVKLKGEIQEFLHLDKLVVILCEQGDPFGHADSVLRMVDDRRAVINDYTWAQPSYGRELKTILKRAGIESNPITYRPTSRKSKGIPSAEGCYINYLETSKAVLVPTSGTSNDETALRELQTIFSDRTVIPLKATTIAKHGGSLHCVTATYRQ